MKKHEILPAALTVSIFIVLFWAGFFFTDRMPFPVGIQSTVFYPLNALFHIMPYVPAFKTFFFLNMLLGALFAFALARSYKLSVWAALLVSLVFTLNGRMNDRLESMNIFAASAWLPLSVLAFKKFNEGGKTLWFFALAFSLAMQIFAGGAQIFLYAFIFLSLYTMYFAITGKKWLKMSLFLLGAGLFALLFSAVLLLPYGGRYFDSPKAAGFNLSDAAGLSLPFSRLAGFIFPGCFGNSSVSSCIPAGKVQPLTALYCGFLPFIFAFFCGIDRKKPETLFYLASFLIFPFYALLGAVLPLAVLSGFGFDALLKGAARKKQALVPKLPWLFFFLFFIMLIGAFLLYKPSCPGLFAVAALDAWAALAAAAGFLILFTLFRKKKIDKDVFALLIVLFIFTDLLFYGGRDNSIRREPERIGHTVLKAVDRGMRN